MKTFEIEVTHMVSVTVDETKFTEEFLQEFRESFYDFDDLQAHAEHLGQLYARGIIDGYSEDEFVEGYGEVKDFGIKLDTVFWEVETVAVE